MQWLDAIPRRRQLKRMHRRQPERLGGVRHFAVESLTIFPDRVLDDQTPHGTMRARLRWIYKHAMAVGYRRSFR